MLSVIVYCLVMERKENVLYLHLSTAKHGIFQYTFEYRKCASVLIDLNLMLPNNIYCSAVCQI
jgi:hypothetical protein